MQRPHDKQDSDIEWIKTQVKKKIASIPRKAYHTMLSCLKTDRMMAFASGTMPYTDCRSQSYSDHYRLQLVIPRERK